MEISTAIEANAVHVRQNDSLLAAAERRLLIRMARRLPRWVNSDQLTLLGLIGMVVTGGAWLASNWHELALLGVVAGLVINWFGDSLDGTVARVRDQQRPRYGYYIDHVVDVAGMLLLCGGLALSPYMGAVPALLLLAAWLAVSAETYLATHSLGVFRLAVCRLGPTELRLLLIAGVAALLLRGRDVALCGQSWRLFDVGGAVAAAGLLAVLVVSVARNAWVLHRAEPLRR